ncbi:MAG: DoxX family membrane protein, partial [Streptomyces sp.]|nr:DoxX family membrane protein [Streptomyces sp.]
MKGHDAAALALRATLGPMLFAHGWNKVAGPGGLKGTTGWFEALGL